MFLFLMIKLMQDGIAKENIEKIRTDNTASDYFLCVSLSVCLDEFNAGLTLMEAKFLQHQKLEIITTIVQSLPLLLIIIIMQKRSMLLSLAVNIQQLLNNNEIPPKYF